MANALAWGFVGLQHLFAQRLSEVNVRVINDAVAQSLAEWNRELGEMTSQLVARTTVAQERFRLPGGGTLQPLDEHGIPLPVRVGAFADIGFPIKGGGTAWGTNRVSRALMTVAEANDFQVMVQSQDADWMRRHILGALLTNVSYAFEDPEVGALTVYPLANGDTQQYMINGGLATAQHYTAQAADILDASNPFPTIYDKLSAAAGNDGPFVSYIADDLRSDVEALATFVPISDPDIELGSGSDRLRGAPGGITAFGQEVIGKVDGMWIVTWRSLPSGYIVSLAAGASAPAIAMREYPDASIQGLFEEDHSPDGNRAERRFIRYAGFGVRNRTAGVVTQIGNGAYTVPTIYTAPLAV